MGFFQYLKPKPVKEQGSTDDSTNTEPAKRLVQPRTRSFAAVSELRPNTSLSNTQSHASLTPSAFSEKCDDVESFKHSIICEYIADQQHLNLWVDSLDSINQGVLVRVRGGEYVAHPPQLLQGSLAANIAVLNIPVRVQACSCTDQN